MRKYVGMFFGVACCASAGCFLGSNGVDRRSGQVELFQINSDDQSLRRPFSAPDILQEQRERKDLTQNWGNRLRYGSDSVTIQVHAINLERIPATITGSKDVVVFSEVWDNAASSYDSRPLTSIVYIGKNQLVPGKMNFDGALAFGPSSFKGNPMKVRFTVMVLQKERGQQQAELAEVIGKYASLVPAYGAIASDVVGVIRDMLRAQADVISFDYEATLLSDNPAPNISSLAVNTGSRGDSRPVAAADRSRWDSFDVRMGWLQYGFFALVETRRRNDTVMYPFAASSSNDASFPDSDAIWTSGGIFTKNQPRPAQADRSPVQSTAGNSQGANTGDPGLTPVKTNYLIFSITPGQIPQGDEFLRVASDANRALLGDLRQTKENVRNSLDSIRQRATDLKAGVVEARLQSIANRLATQRNQDARKFEAEFLREASTVIDGALASETSEADRKRLEPLLRDASDRISQRYYSDLLSLDIDRPDVANAELISRVVSAEASLDEIKSLVQSAADATASLTSARAAIDAALEKPALPADFSEVADTLTRLANAGERPDQAILAAAVRTYSDFTPKADQLTTLYLRIPAMDRDIVSAAARADASLALAKAKLEATGAQASALQISVDETLRVRIEGIKAAQPTDATSTVKELSELVSLRDRARGVFDAVNTSMTRRADLEASAARLKPPAPEDIANRMKAMQAAIAAHAQLRTALEARGVKFPG
jgi:hypothetical protein